MAVDKGKCSSTKLNSSSCGSSTLRLTGSLKEMCFIEAVFCMPPCQGL
jgi:hypothetical protein